VQDQIAGAKRAPRTPPQARKVALAASGRGRRGSETEPPKPRSNLEARPRSEAKPSGGTSGPPRRRDPQLLFVYGTLRPAAAPPGAAGLVARLPRLGSGWLAGRLYDLGPYPGAVPDPRCAERVHGEVFELPDDPACLRAIDAYEGFEPADPTGSLFVRVEAAVRLDDGSERRCLVYAWNRDPRRARAVPGGDWLEWRARRGARSTRREPGSGD
jgi:gamma-glutamylcyclotransferase (GGCT)/AIG2-like uncharacterized protein YtfP